MSKIHQIENYLLHSFENIVAEKMDGYFLVLFLEAVAYLLLGTLGVNSHILILGLLLLFIIVLLLGKYQNIP